MPSTRRQLDPLAWHRLEATVMETSRALRRALDARFAPLDLNLTQALLLAYLDEHGEATQITLADALHMNRASAGAVVDNLHSRDLVRRDASPSDRRVWLVRLTPAGRELAAEAGAVDLAVREQLRAGISRADRQQLVQTLVRVQENVAALLTEDE